MDLAMTGKKAIVTGVSAGIGKAITWSFARD
jgi:NAD(P)-dependent dehydrogenase (short-subunit alcohol dehydrogenase family)